MKNCIRPHYEKLKPLKSGFIENSNFENNRDPCTWFHGNKSWEIFPFSQRPRYIFLKNRRQSNNFTKDIVVISSYYNLEDKTPSYNVPSQLSKATTLITTNNWFFKTDNFDELITLHLDDIIVVDVQLITKLEELIAGASWCLINSSQFRM